MATVQAAAATHAASGAAAPASGADAAGLQLLAQTSMDMRQRLDSLYAEVAEFKAGFAGVNIVHELEDLRSVRNPRSHACSTCSTTCTLLYTQHDPAACET